MTSGSRVKTDSSETSVRPIVYVAGHRGMVGAAIVRHLEAIGRATIVTASHSELDLTDQRATESFFAARQIDQVYLAAARVGGIYANDTYPADFIGENLLIQLNVIRAAHRHGVQRLLFLGSSCIYPKFAVQPIPEEALLTGNLEATNEPYAIAKIAGIKLCESYNRQYGRDYRSVMPTNLYGPGDNFHPENSHVIPALIQRFHEAKLRDDREVSVWGSGTPRREFLHVHDMAAACVHVMELNINIWRKYTQPMLSHLNVGSGEDIAIRELAEIIAHVVGFQGRITYDTRLPDGTPRKLLDVSRLAALGWRAKISLEKGLANTYSWYVDHLRDVRST